METGRDFRSIIHSVPFTFLVGPNHTKLTIQSGLARHVSRPLDHLMNSGETRESKHQIAVLEDEDVETFVAFCEYAYTGNYSVPPPGFREEDREQDILNNPFKGMFSGESSPVSAMAQSPQRSGQSPSKPPENSFGDEANGYGDGYYVYNEGSRGSYQEPHEMLPAYTYGIDPRTWYVSTTTAYPPQDPTATPRHSNESGTHTSSSSPSRGRRRHKGKPGRKKNSKKEQVVIDNPPRLTPPTTPPPSHTQQEPVIPPPTETASVQDESCQEQNSGDEEKVFETKDQIRSSQKDTWERSVTASQSREDMTETEGYDTGEGEEGSARGPTRPIIDTSFANQEFSPRHERGTSLWDEFAAIDDTESSQYYKQRPANTFPGFGLPYLIFHAKVYVFATRYLIPDLAHLCLRKLHRDLLNLSFPESDTGDQYAEHFVLTTTKARMVLDLLHYTYTKTTRLEPILPTAATQLRDNELRRLVVHYAACKVRDLAVYCPPVERVIGSPSYPEKPSARGLRALLDTLPELASDLVYRML